MAEQEVVLVGGFNFHRWDKPPDGTDFVNQFCRNRADYLLAHNRKLKRAKFTLFNMGAGVIEVNEVSKYGGRRWQPLSSPTFKAITRDHYDKHTFHEEGDCHDNDEQTSQRVMSITDVYKYVIQIGQRDPGTLVELSFFSHSTRKGPTFVNSYEHLPTGATKRNCHDKDGRYDKDFKDPNMKPEALALFRKAFALGGYIWVWGCDAIFAYWMVFNRLRLTTKYQRTKAPKLADSDTFVLAFTKDEAFNISLESEEFLPPKLIQGSQPIKVEYTLAQIKRFFQRGLPDNYTTVVANAARVLCYGALPGFGASMQGRDKLMGIREQDYPGFLGFYKNYLGITEDPESRGYGTFIPK